MNDGGLANATDAEKDGILSGGDWRFYDSGCGDSGSENDDDDDNDYDELGCEVSGTDRAIGRTNRRWESLGERRLLAWRKEERPWEWIFDQFPDRSEGAVRACWHMLQWPARRAD